MKPLHSDILSLRHDTELPVYVVIDIESTMDGNTKFSAHPFCPENKLLCYSAVFLYDGKKIDDCSGADIRDLIRKIETSIIPKVSRHLVLVGHNIKFDTHYLAINGFPMDYVIGLIDTQFMHYILTGEKQASLADLAREYLSDTKSDTLKEAMSIGMDIKDIPESALITYCESDTLLTYSVYSIMDGELSYKERVLNNIYARYTMGLWMMEFSGIKVDKKKLYDGKALLERASKEITIDLNSSYHSIMPANRAKSSSPTSAKFLNQLVFGTDIETKDKIVVGQYKNGNPKFGYKVGVTNLPANISVAHVFKSTKEQKKHTLKSGDISMDNKIIQAILDTGKLDCITSKILNSVLEVRQIDKLLKTYIQPIAQYMDDTNGEYLHPIYNTSTTDTGRSSATKPNVQNFPPEVEAMLAKEDDYVYISSDWKQLEMWGAAVLSQDIQLITDLEEGVDIHQRTYEQAGSPPAVTRTDVKGINFGTIYGGKPYTLSQQSGVPILVVETIQEALWARYPGLKSYYDNAYSDLDKARKVGTWVKDGHSLDTVETTSLTGRKYRFKQFPNKWSGKHEFSWPQSCNYPIQGFATGDLHPLFIACVVYTQQMGMISSEYAILERTIHDSLMARIPIKGTLSGKQLSNIYVDYLQEVSEFTLTVLRLWIQRAPEEVYFPYLKLEHKITIGDDTYVTSD